MFSLKWKVSQIGRNFRGLCFSIVVVVLLTLALFGPWWSVNSKTTFSSGLLGGSSFSSEGLYKLRELSVTTKSDSTTISATVSYDEYAENIKKMGFENACDDSLGSINLTFYMVVAVLVVAVISTIVCFIRPTMIVLIAVFVASLIAPIYFAIGVPAAVNKDARDGGATLTTEVSFIGSTTTTSGGATTTLSWGPGWGWILSVAAVVVALIGVFVVWRRPAAVEPWPAEEAPKREVPERAAPPPPEKIELLPKAKPEEIEERVYQYIERKGGEIDVEECAEELGLSADEVEVAIGALEKKGKLERG